MIKITLYFVAEKTEHYRDDATYEVLSGPYVLLKDAKEAKAAIPHRENMPWEEKSIVLLEAPMDERMTGEVSDYAEREA